MLISKVNGDKNKMCHSFLSSVQHNPALCREKLYFHHIHEVKNVAGIFHTLICGRFEPLTFWLRNNDRLVQSKRS